MPQKAKQVKRVLIGIDGNADFNTVGGKLYVPHGLPGEPTHAQIITRGIAAFKSSLFAHRAFSTENHHPKHIEFQKFGPHAVMGTPGQKYHRALLEIFGEADLIMEKGLHPAIISHSVATSPQFFLQIPILRLMGIEEIYLWGWFRTHCVGRSAIDYAYQGFKVFIIKDATMSIPPPLGNPEYMDEMLRLSEVRDIRLSELGIHI